MDSSHEARPAWLRLAGWASAAAALSFVVFGMAFVQPSGDRAITVAGSFAGDDPPPDLSFVDDGVLPDGASPSGASPVADTIETEPIGTGPTGVEDTIETEPIETQSISVEDTIETEPIDAAADAVTTAEMGFTDPFETVGPSWTALAGTWVGSDGRFVQQDTTGFDLIAQLELDVPDSFHVSVVMVPMSGALSAGILIGQQVSGERAGASAVDFSEGGSFVRFGRYLEDDAAYEYVEGLAVPEGFDPAIAHELAVVVEPADTTVFIDGEYFATFGPAPAGRVGLLANSAATGFDDFAIEPV